MNDTLKHVQANADNLLPNRRLSTDILAAALAMTALADWLFYNQLIMSGWIIGGFVLVLLTAIWWASPAIARHRANGILFAAVAGLCLRCVYEPTMLAMVLMPIGLITVALSRREGWTDKVELWFVRWMELLSLGWLKCLLRIALTARNVPLGGAAERLHRKLGLWIVPILLGAVFLTLFAVANPLISQVLNSCWSWLSCSTIPHPSFTRILFWLAVSTLMTTLLSHETGIHDTPASHGKIQDAGIADGVMSEILTPGVIIRSLLVFNVLFAIQSVLDLIYLWGGAALPEGMTNAEYAQRGAYPLVAAALLAGAFVLAAFRPGTDATGLRTQRRLVYLWLGQTLMLVISSAWRLWLYVGTYSLTRLRFAAAVWMILVALGLVWIVVRVARHKSGRWLVNMNAITTATVLYLCALTGADTHIAWFNVKHCEEVLGEGHRELDANYLIGFEQAAIPALLWIHQSYPDHVNEAVWRNAIREASINLEVRVNNWRGWTLLRKRAYAALSDWNWDREDRFSFGKVVSVSGDLLAIREYDFAKDMDVDVTYTINPETEFGNINCLTDLRAGDDVVLDYAEEGHRRTVTTLVREEMEETAVEAPQYSRRCEPAAPDEPPPSPTTGSGLTAPAVLPGSPQYSRRYEPAAPDERDQLPADIGIITTGRVVSLQPGRLTLRETGELAGTFTNCAYTIASRVELRGLQSLSDLQLDQRVTYRVITPDGQPTIIEIATRGEVLTDEP